MNPAPLHLAQIVADGRPGGGTTMVLGLVDDLLAGGRYRITLISQPASYLEQQARRRGLSFVGIDFFTAIGDLRLPWRLARQLGPERFDISHLHGLRAAHHAVRWPLRPRLGRLVYTVHGLHQLHQPGWLRWLANRADRQVMARVDARVFVSRADQNAAARWGLLPGGEPGRVIYNGCDLPALEGRRRAEREVDALFIGRHVAQKNPELAARVLATLAAAGHRCVMAGDGPLRARCLQLLHSLPGGDRVECLGELAHDDTLALLARSRVLLMPSRWEGLPILPIEAMALGVPVVASRLPGVDEVVDDGVTGELTAPGDEHSMAQAVLRLLGDPARWQRLCAAGHLLTTSRFDRAAGSAAYGSLYDELSGRRR